MAKSLIHSHSLAALALLGAGAAAAAAGPAEAAVQYDLVDQSYAFVVPPGNAAFTTPPPFDLQLTVSDAAVARGSLAVNVDANTRPLALSGDADDLVSLRASADVYQPGRASSRGFANIELSFNATGDVTASAIRYFGDLSGARLRGTGDAISGFYVTEGGGCPGNDSSPIGNSGGQIVDASTSAAVRPSCSDGAYTTSLVSSWSSGPKNGSPWTWSQCRWLTRAAPRNGAEQPRPK